MAGKLTDDDLQALEWYWGARDLQSQPIDPKRYGGDPWYYTPNDAGVRVTPETAFQVSTVWACIDVISRAIASSDWNVYSLKPNGDHEYLPGDSLNYLLNTRPNTDMTAQSFKRAVMISALSWGNGYAEISRDLAGRVAALWPICPDRVQPSRYDGALYYVVDNPDGSKVAIPQRDMYHVRGPGITGLYGDNAITRASRTIALALAQEKFAEAYFGNNTQLGVTLEVPGSLDDASYKRLKREWNQRHRGAGKAFKVAILESGMKASPITSHADDAQLTDARYQQVEEICRWFGVPPHMVQHLQRSTFNNIEHLGISFSRDGLRPWSRELTQEADYKLFSDRGPWRVTMIDLAWASQGDFKTRMEGYQLGRNMGIYSANDILRKEGENAIGPDGDIRIVNAAAVRLEDVGKNLMADTTAPAMPDAQGDAARNAFVSVFASVFERAQRRQNARAADLRKTSRDTAEADAKLKAFESDQVAFLRDQLAEPCSQLSAVVKTDTYKAALTVGAQVLQFGEPTEAATAFVDQFLKGAA